MCPSNFIRESWESNSGLCEGKMLGHFVLIKEAIWSGIKNGQQDCLLAEVISYVHYTMWFVRDDVDAFLAAFHVADVTTDALFCSIEAFCKQRDHITGILAAIGL